MAPESYSCVLEILLPMLELALEPLLLAASYSPLHKTQGRAPTVLDGKEKGWATQPDLISTHLSISGNVHDSRSLHAGRDDRV
jgi:hypothetical protein